MTDRQWFYRIVAAAGLASLGGFLYAGAQADRLARIGAGYKAKIACSERFVAGRDADAVLQAEFAGIDPMLDRIRVRIDERRRSVRASGPLGLGQARAVYRDGYGCTLTNGGRAADLPALAPMAAGDPWPVAPRGAQDAAARVDYAALDAALAGAFEENATGNRAVLVAVDGRIVAERYADGFSRETSFLSWSMAKSVTATLIGAAVHRGLIDIDAPAPVDAWRDDPVRAQITWRDLLHMQSGLDFEEAYDDARSDVNRMLFEASDAGAAAIRARPAHAPGEVWSYSSGTTNILARLLRETLAREGLNDQEFARKALLAPIGADSVILEPDASGVFVGSSFAYATARDWARLGQLYLQDGVWDGARLLPEGWSAFVAAPAARSDNQYGAHFWLNRDGADGRARFFKGLPESVYMMSGHEGQYVLIDPSRNAIIVRTGLTRGQAPAAATAPLFAALYDAIGGMSDGAANGASGDDATTRAGALSADR